MGFEFPEWIVSDKVRDLFREHMLKGWVFQPVLELGTEVYKEYVNLWSSFFKLVADCGKHQVRGESVTDWKG